MAAVSERIEYMEKVRREVLKLLTECKTADMLKQNLSQQDQMIDKLLNTQKTAKQLIKELMITEEKVAQRLSDREEELKASIQKLQKIEQKWLQTNKKDEKLRINIKYPFMLASAHYGPDIAQSINLDSSQHSPCFISDYLWNLVNTSW
ncbi:hypothetical protein E2320_016620 [Naja naja]|nr:hypothetical protein E2320_016620 [Naja naja]